MTKPLTTLRTPAQLIEAGLAHEGARAELERIDARYAVAITPTVAAQIDRADPTDPIALQFVPTAAELHTSVDEQADPIGDDTHSPVKGIVHRYRDRVLLKLANVCPVYCRFCFRRENVGVGADATLSGSELSAALDYVAGHPEIFEVIVTGGDPLILAPRRIFEVTRAIGAISHVKIIRWHTRVPVVAPERVTPELIGGLTATSGKAAYVAIHANHPRELNSAARAAIAALRAAGLVLISQTVLLKGINDDVATLEELMRALLASGVKPYYLHHGDLAPGTGHFRTTIEEGRELMRALRGRLTGIAMPAYVLDIPGGFGKVPIDDDHVGPVDPRTGARTVIDPWGKPHIYRDCLDPSRFNSNGS